jgi:hypothetical protein
MTTAKMTEMISTANTFPPALISQARQGLYTRYWGRHALLGMQQ